MLDLMKQCHGVRFVPVPRVSRWALFFLLENRRSSGEKGVRRCDVGVPVGGGCDVWEGALGDRGEGRADRGVAVDALDV